MVADGVDASERWAEIGDESILGTRPWRGSTPVQIFDVEKHREPKQDAGQTRKCRGEIVPITPIKRFKRGFRARGQDRPTTHQIPPPDTSVPQG